MTRDDRYVPAGLSVPDDLTPGAVAALARALRQRSGAAESVERMLAAVDPLAEVARRWRDDADPIRAEALDLLPRHSPFSREMWADALDLMFAPITPSALRALVAEELAAVGPVRFPPLVGLVLAGNVPAPAVQAVFCGLLAGSAMLVKSAGEDRAWPALLARSVASVSPDLGGRVAVVHWPGGSAPHNAALASSADPIVAFGGSEAIAEWSILVAASRERKLAGASQAPRASARPGLVAHGPRTSLGLVELPGDEAAMRELAGAVARDAAMYDQQGCLSPQQVYLVESDAAAASAGGARPWPRAATFARLLGQALDELARRWTIGDRDLGLRLAVRRARESARMRRVVARLEGGASGRPGIAGMPGPWLLSGPPDRFDWTLIGTSGTSPQVGPGGRTLLLTRVRSGDEAIDAIRPLAPLIQGVALHAGHDEDRLARRLIDELAIPYVCRPGELQRPPFGWRNDNVPPLRSLAVDQT